MTSGVSNSSPSAYKEIMQVTELGSSQWCMAGGRDITDKWKLGRVTLDRRRSCFPVRTVRQWHRLPKEVVKFLSLEVFKP